MCWDWFWEFFTWSVLYMPFVIFGLVKGGGRHPPPFPLLGETLCILLCTHTLYTVYLLNVKSVNNTILLDVVLLCRCGMFYWRSSPLTRTVVRRGRVGREEVRRGRPQATPTLILLSPMGRGAVNSSSQLSLLVPSLTSWKGSPMDCRYWEYVHTGKLEVLATAVSKCMILSSNVHFRICDQVYRACIILITYVHVHVCCVALPCLFVWSCLLLSFFLLISHLKTCTCNCFFPYIKAYLLFASKGVVVYHV